ncbi:deubiquitinating enzyme [Exophiala xenobiotica]|uniref:Ubiquitin carboxyl-terminal hydrolase n=1 Tax=Vermiconidia calcicola TaxID=1690605 RepID=A0AAV9QKH2_9PEZI|nr:deubiquitinating enzyme [Exophiala xenobiotica]KAK5545638.1 deubiquitinating enzyme [Vermiconidia calcicola]KAK5550101.1 deubiquitinating enzyme [Chaetothyriales sp. CCFEE 6169]KAK5208558.1 deubiquitinating enzyme [Exophiala xenobiotica]KAK5229979.1 deubiquitinating enzyme [Exophiala xenobiotica]
MATIPIIIKHQGKKYNVDLDPSANGEMLKFQLFSLTGVEPERQSLLIKGGKLKDDTDLSKLNAKPGQIFTMLGTASSEGSAIVAPVEKPKFLEDMTAAEIAAQEGAIPAGLQNLGNTCYLNSTLQVLRSIPEMQEGLKTYNPDLASSSSLQDLSRFGLGGLGSSNDLTAQLRDLYKQMSETQEGFPPLMFLDALRTAYPQFAQKAKTGHGYAQQDAEEAWSQILQQLRQKLKITEKSSPEQKEIAFIDRYMAGTYHASVVPPADAAENEPVVESDDVFLKLDCHIDQSINHLRDGLLAGLTEEIEKNSPTLGRNAIYTKTSRVSRLPKYLTVHFVRFFWKKDAQKKAKILRKVTFPEELDVVEFCTDDLKKRLIPVRDKVREVRKDEQDMERARKRQKLRHKQEEDRKHDETFKAQEAAPIAKLRDQKEPKEKEAEGGEMDVYKTDAEYEAERTESIKRAKKELHALIDQQLAEDEGANKSGLYELKGVITHQGASADSGHYTSFVKKQAKVVDDPKAPGGKRREDDGKWWWFNDDKVSEVDAERILSLAGGGESASALMLLYRAIDLPTRDEIEE